MSIKKAKAKWMKVYYVDTNVFLRFLLRDIPTQYTIAEKLFKKAKSGKVKLVLPQIIIFEIYFILNTFYHLSKPEIIEKIQSLLAVKYFHVQNKEIFKKAIKLFEKSNNSLADCFLLAKADYAKAELFSFDKKLIALHKKQKVK
ncbi:MAG: PIN domain-containing protein [Candidatus Levybacteria bacterium]|nr:PIN domain-containing protein [Candidatus Levybacteria bacterium]